MLNTYFCSIMTKEEHINYWLSTAEDDEVNMNALLIREDIQQLFSSVISTLKKYARHFGLKTMRTIRRRFHTILFGC